MRIIEQPELERVKAGEIPRHIGAIMDGNGRWALMRETERTEGHRAAEEAVYSSVHGALNLGVEWLSLYAFSTENWRRNEAEIEFLMDFSEWLLREERVEELRGLGVRIRFIGRLDDPRIPDRSRAYLEDISRRTAHNTRMQLVIAFNYGGRAEILDSVRGLLRRGADPERLTEADLEAGLYLPEMPDLDLVVRTSAEHRLSNFLLWQASYAEFVFTETLWPDFRAWHLYSAVAEFQSRRRRMGAAVTG
ncbi:MAG: polyprenyl diphosphate synthase [Microthrixaceae bacterium]